jgi:phosphoglycolate phosphatase-like HAD superfamily hydrolase
MFVETIQQKPHPYPIEQILKKHSLHASEALMLDDLKPGLEMARSCQVDFAAAGWSHSIPEIKSHMQTESTYYFETVEQFNGFLFSE